jgi:tetratricopeptide (TPR) repeat protein
LIRALELDPDYATAHNWYGDLLTIQGQLEAGAEEKRKGQASDPLSLILNTEIGRDFMFLYQWDRAIAQLQKTLEMDPNFGVAHRWLVWAYWENGLREEAIEQSETCVALERRVAYLPRFLRQVVSDDRAEAIRILTDADGDPFDLALYYALAGENDSALDWLAQAINEHRMGAAYLRVDPRWDSLRDDLRFQDLLRVNLEA